MVKCDCLKGEGNTRDKEKESHDKTETKRYYTFPRNREKITDNIYDIYNDR